MREIKFRGKEECSGEWVYGYYCMGGWIDPVNGIETPRHIIHAEYLFDVDQDTIGQYTGLKDKKGKEIYEGDIVLVNDWTSIYASDYKGIVCFKRGQWVVSYEKYGWEQTPRLFFDDFADRKTEVIGNIYDNPELLEKE